MNESQPTVEEAPKPPQLSKHNHANPTMIVISTLLAVFAVAAIVLAGIGLVNNFGSAATPQGSNELTAVVGSGSVEYRVSGAVTIEPQYEVSVRASNPDGDSPVVTSDGMKLGVDVNAGEVVTAIAGRPVIALPGVLPAYRDINPGSIGPDVTQLQDALKGLGYVVKDDLGIFGWSTANAVIKLYRDRGYAAPGMTASDTWETVRIPAAELIFVPTFPIQATTDCGQKGDLASTTVCTLAGGNVRAFITVSGSDSERLSAGQEVTITAPGGKIIRGSLGEEAPLPVTQDDKPRADSSLSGIQHRFVVTVKGELPKELAGTTTVGSILTESSPPNSLTVAQTAIRTDGLGGAWLEVTTESNGKQKVPIELAVCSGGLCSFTGDVRPGTVVSLNFRSQSG